MVDLAALIMSMDTLQLGGIGLATMGSIGLITYVFLKKKQTNGFLGTDAQFLDISGLEEKPHLDLDETYALNTQITSLGGTNDLVTSALVYDGYGSKEEASQILREAMEQETNTKEKVRLHVISKNYMSNLGTLAELVERYPSFIKKPLSTDSEQTNTSSPEQIDLFSTKKNNHQNEPAKTLAELVERYPNFIKKPLSTDSEQTNISSPEQIDLFATRKNDQSLVATDPTVENYKTPVVKETVETTISYSELPVLTDIAEETIMTDIVSQSQIIDAKKAQENEQDTNNFFEAFGDLAKQIHEDNNLSEKPDKEEKAQKIVFTEAKEKEIYDIWANYMSLFGGRMNLKNTFIHLEHPWGTISSIAELQEKINYEIGKDTSGNQIPWAIISVLPLKDTQK